MIEHFEGTVHADAPTTVDATHQPSSGGTAASSATDTVPTTPSAIGDAPVPTPVVLGDLDDDPPAELSALAAAAAKRVPKPV